MKKLQIRRIAVIGLLVMIQPVLGQNVSYGQQAPHQKQTLNKKQAPHEQTLSKLLMDYIRPTVFSLTMVMVHDVVNPPAASRYYAYAMLGAYAIVTKNNAGLVDASAFIKSYPKNIRLTADPHSYDYRIAAVYSILETGKLMLPSGFMLQEQESKFIKTLQKNKVPRALIDRSLAVAREATAQIVAWSKSDNYNRLSAKLRYTPLKGDQYWYPTPPTYMEAVEPNWRTIRPMVIDSCDEFIPPPLAVFSKDTTSAFYKLAKEVYTISKDTGAQSLNERTIAGFWDCNPFAVATQGHMMIGFKKMSPGGHWMDIVANVAGVTHLDFGHTIQASALVAVTLMDGFICSWDEKYRSNRLRPETYINRYMDIKWQPYLQTPPFPEYTSAHSVISTASAEVLTYLFGTRLDYTDNAEQLFEITPRAFHSFREAAQEAAISRLYGGIHYRDGVVNGQVLGKNVGELVVERMKTAGITPYTP